MTAVHLCWFCRTRLLREGAKVQDVGADTEKDTCGICNKVRYGILCAVDLKRKDEKK